MNALGAGAVVTYGDRPPGSDPDPRRTRDERVVAMLAAWRRRDRGRSDPRADRPRHRRGRRRGRGEGRRGGNAAQAGRPAAPPRSARRGRRHHRGDCHRGRPRLAERDARRRPVARPEGGQPRPRRVRRDEAGRREPVRGGAYGTGNRRHGDRRQLAAGGQHRDPGGPRTRRGSRSSCRSRSSWPRSWPTRHRASPRTCRRRRRASRAPSRRRRPPAPPSPSASSSSSKSADPDDPSQSKPVGPDVRRERTPSAALVPAPPSASDSDKPSTSDSGSSTPDVTKQPDKPKPAPDNTEGSTDPITKPAPSSGGQPVSEAGTSHPGSGRAEGADDHHGHHGIRNDGVRNDGVRNDGVGVGGDEGRRDRDDQDELTAHDDGPLPSGRGPFAVAGVGLSRRTAPRPRNRGSTPS